MIGCNRYKLILSWDCD